MLPVVPAGISPGPSDAWKMLLVKYACCGAISFTIYETVFTLDDESRWIWKKPKSSLTRWLYLFSKYFALLVQVLNMISTFVLHSRYPLDRQICRKWFICRVTAAQMMLVCIEVILMARVHMLYGQNRVAIWFLTIVLLGEIALMSVAVVILQRHLEFSHACLITSTPRIVAYFGTGGMTTHVFILMFTLLPIAIRKGWRAIPIIPVIRDGMFAFFVVSALLVVTMLYDTFRHEVASAVFSSFISIVSSAGCRLIINLHNMAAEAVERSRELDSDSAFQLSTSIFESEESSDPKTSR